LRHLALGILDASDDVSGDEEIAVERAFIELLRSAIGKGPSGHPVAAESTRYAAALNFIAQNLADPALNPGLVAAHLDLSTRSLSRLFALNGRTIERSIWARRLEQARDQLADPLLRHRSITEVAFACGFNDAAHFSRSFLSAYGMTPRQFRAMVQSGE
jgi:AraC-like DNA-binding protein